MPGTWNSTVKQVDMVLLLGELQSSEGNRDLNAT